MKKLLSIAFIVILSASKVSANDLYMGIGLSAERLKYSSLNIIGILGYNINQSLSLEVETSFAIVPAKMGVKETTPPDTAYSHYVDYKINHTAAFAKLTLPTSLFIKPFARLGVANIKTEAISIKENQTELSYGIGAQWATSERLGLRIDYTIVNVDTVGNGSEGLFALNTVYRF